MRTVHLVVASSLAACCVVLGSLADPIHEPACRDVPRPERAPSRVEVPRLPLAFEPNVGQTDPSVRFTARERGITVFVRPTDAVLSFRGASVRMRLEGAREDADVVAVDELPGKVNWFLGNDPALWRTDVATFRRVECRGVWPGIDLAYHGAGGRLEYDFVVAPGADPDVIALAFEGADSVDVDPATGDLVVSVAGGELRQERPTVYQDDGADRRPIDGSFVLHGDRRVGFHVAGYDRGRTLVIDPPLAYAGFIGADDEDYASQITVDSAGYAYACGSTVSHDFPRVYGPDPKLRWTRSEWPGMNAWLTKTSPAGTSLVYSTYFGGYGSDTATGVAVDEQGNAFVCGTTDSKDLPMTAGGFDALIGDGSASQPSTDAFVLEFDTRGSAILSSTYLGGTGVEDSRGIVFDGSGRVVVLGSSDGTFPPAYTTTGAFQPVRSGSNDAYLLWLDAAGAVDSMTWFGGQGFEFATAIARDASGDVVITGGTASSSVAGVTPLRPHAGGYDLFVAKFHGASTLSWFTYLGGSGSEPAYYADVDIDASGHVVLAATTASADFPATGFQRKFAGDGKGGYDAVVARFAGDGALEWSTYLGGTGNEYPVAVAVNKADGRIFVAGSTNSTDFPSAGPDFPANAGLADLFLAELDPSGTSLPSSTLFGGDKGDFVSDVCLGPDGAAYVLGMSNSNLGGTPTSFGPHTSHDTWALEVFVAKFGGTGPASDTLTLTPTKGRLTDGPKPRRDAFQASGRLAFGPGSPDGTFDPAAGSVTVSFGTRADPGVLVIPPGKGWTSRNGRHRWRSSGSGPNASVFNRLPSQPKASLVIDTRRGTWSVSVQNFEFPAAVTNPVLVALATSDDAGLDERAWRSRGRGRFTLP